MPASTSKDNDRPAAPTEPAAAPTGSAAPTAPARPKRPPRSQRPTPARGRGRRLGGSAAATGDAPVAAKPTAGSPTSTGRGPRSAHPPDLARRRLVDTPGPDPTTPLAETMLVVGRIIGTHGVHGELKVVILTDDPEHLASLKRLWLGVEPRPRKVLGIRFHAGNALVRLSGITTPDAGREFRGQPLRMAGTDARPLAPGEFRLYQLVGLEAVTETGKSLGRVADVLETGANDVFVVTPVDGGSDLLLPYHPDVILDISPEAGRMVVRPMLYFDEAPLGEAEGPESVAGGGGGAEGGTGRREDGEGDLASE